MYPNIIGQTECFARVHIEIYERDVNVDDADADADEWMHATAA